MTKKAKNDADKLDTFDAPKKRGRPPGKKKAKIVAKKAVKRKYTKRTWPKLKKQETVKKMQFTSQPFTPAELPTAEVMLRAAFLNWCVEKLLAA